MIQIVLMIQNGPVPGFDSGKGIIAFYHCATGLKPHAAPFPVS